MEESKIIDKIDKLLANKDDELYITMVERLKFDWLPEDIASRLLQKSCETLRRNSSEWRIKKMTAGGKGFLYKYSDIVKFIERNAA